MRIAFCLYVYCWLCTHTKGLSFSLTNQSSPTYSQSALLQDDCKHAINDFAQDDIIAAMQVLLNSKIIDTILTLKVILEL